MSTFPRVSIAGFSESQSKYNKKYIYHDGVCQALYDKYKELFENHCIFINDDFIIGSVPEVETAEVTIILSKEKVDLESSIFDLIQDKEEYQSFNFSIMYWSYRTFRDAVDMIRDILRNKANKFYRIDIEIRPSESTQYRL